MLYKMTVFTDTPLLAVPPIIIALSFHLTVVTTVLTTSPKAVDLVPPNITKILQRLAVDENRQASAFYISALWYMVDGVRYCKLFGKVREIPTMSTD